MDPENLSTDYLVSAKVNSQHLLTIPKKVQRLIFSDDINKTSRVYYWYLHENNQNEYVYIANNTPREENSYTVAPTEPHSNTPNRTTIPDEIVNKKQIEEDDTLYFYAHDKTADEENPSVAILTESQLISKLDSGIQSDTGETLHRMASCGTAYDQLSRK
jgi:hypothetical protein